MKGATCVCALFHGEIKLICLMDSSLLLLFFSIHLEELRHVHSIVKWDC